MNFGFDLDNTITAEPEAFRLLMEALVAAGHGVHVITGVMPGVTDEHLATVDGRAEQLRSLGLRQDEHYTTIHLAMARGAAAIGHRKRELCSSLGIELMFEDRSDYANAMREVTRCVLIWPR